MKKLLSKLGNAWCYLFHAGYYWPVNGTVRCRTCLTTYVCPWGRSGK